jgi:protein TonB
MIGRAGWAASGAFAVSLAVHGAFLAGFAPPIGGAEPRAGSPGITMIGQAFEDRVAGVARPVTARHAIRPATPTETAAPMPGAAPVQPTARTAARAVAPAPAASPVRRAPVATAMRPAPDKMTAADIAASDPAARPSTARNVTQADRIAGEDPAGGPAAVLVSPRPHPRPPRPRGWAEADSAAPEPPSAPPAAGNAGADARAGAPEGRQSGSTPRQPSEDAAEVGASARQIARYPQLVNRHLSRLRRPGSAFQGTTVVGFTIARDGGLAALGIVRSSGNPAFDDLALAHVRRAVPFPAPPNGAQTRYSVAIRGR